MTTPPPVQQDAPARRPAERPARVAAVQPGFGAAVRAAGLVTLASRFAGMLRDVLIVQVFGGTALGSAFAAAFTIPNLFRRLFGEGALSAAFIPEYTQTLKVDHDEADKLASYTMLKLGLITGTITVLVEGGLLALLLLLPPDPNRQTSLALMMAMFPFMPAVCGAAILSAMLQVHGRFGVSMSGPFFLNGFIVAVCVYYLATGRIGDTIVAYTLAGATVLSGFAQCYWFARLLRRHARWRADTESARPAARRMLSTFVPVMIGLGGLQFSAFLDLAITMYPIWVGPTIIGYDYPLDEKSNIILRSTQLIYQFPLGVFGVAVATAAFPMLARAADNRGLFLDTIRRGIRLSLFIGLPAAVGLVLVREDITRVLFSFTTARGFGDDELQRSGSVLLGFAPAVWAFSINQLLTRAFYASGDNIIPVRVSLVMVGVNFLFSVIGIWWLRESAIAWAITATTIAQTAILLTIAKRRFCRSGEPVFDGPTVRAATRSATAMIVMGAVVLLTRNIWPLAADASRWLILLRMLLCVGVGGIVYLGEALYSRSPELAWLTSRKGQRTGGQNDDLIVH